MIEIQDYVFDELRTERKAQDEEWGGPSHDDEHTLNDWFQILVKHVGRLSGDLLDLRGFGTASFARQRLVKIAAIAIAAIEAIDRETR